MTETNSESSSSDESDDEETNVECVINPDDDGSKSTEVSSPTKDSPSKRKSNRAVMLTGRGVTTQMLIQEKILEAGEKNLTINYLGNKFVGDLKEDGTIRCNNVDQIFSSPSAWAMHCKKQVNPDKKSGCGWASVKYKGRKLDEFKSTWFRKQKIEQAVAASSENDNPPPYQHQRADIEPLAKTPTTKGRTKSRSSDSSTSHQHEFSSGYVPPTQNYLTFSEALKAVQAGQSVNSKPKMGPLSTPFSKYSSTFLSEERAPRKRPARSRVSVKHSTVSTSSEATTLVECAQFQSTGKIQPFSLSISTNTLLLIDFHCHVSTVEVTGYIVGKWNITRQHMRVIDAYPCLYTSVSTQEDVRRIESEIRCDVEAKGLTLLGWYHSHPFIQADPSIHDINSQLEYQRALRDGHYEPCVALIVSPFESFNKESQINAFWVREPPVTNSKQVGLPLSVRFTTHQDQVLTQDLVNKMVSVVNCYKGSDDAVKIADIWSGESTYSDKLKHSVIRKFPQDQTDGRFLDFIHKMTMAAFA